MSKNTLFKKISYGIFLIIRWIVRLVYPKIVIEGLENLPKEACLLVGNHAQMNGPIIGELYIPGKHKTWCASEMMTLREVPAYAYKDFWSLKPGYTQWFYKLLSYIIAPLCVCIFNNAATIPVYRDARIMSSFRQTVNALCEGCKVTIFPEQAKPYNGILWDFQEGFVDVARLYHKKTGKALPFVPVYVAPRLKKIFLGSPVYFDPTADKAAERSRICGELMTSITDITRALPEHTVVPYLNMAKKDYPKNIPGEV